MSGFNLLYRAGESINKYQGKMVSRLAQENIINRVIVISRSDDIPKNNGKIIDIPSKIGWCNMYEHMPEFHLASPFSLSMLKVIKKYEPMALSISRRDTNFDIYTIEEARRLYYVALKYWYGVVKKYAINYMCFAYVPHTTHEYAVYVIGKALGIPMLVFSVTTIPHLCVYGNSISKIGDCILEDYSSCDSKIKYSISNPFINKYLKRMLYNDQRIELDLVDKKKESKKKSDAEYFRYVRPLNVLAKGRHYAKCIVTGNKLEVEFAKKEFRDTIRAYRSLISQKSLKSYNRIAGMPDYKSPYIFYALHMQPEATVTPGGGLFENQLFAIDLLASAGKSLGITILVKEHYVQSTRDKIFYDDLKKMKNVRLIKTDVSSEKLIINAVAVASLTGSCLLEGALKKKPVFIFGENYYWKGLPGAFLIESYEQCKNILRDILDGKIKSPDNSVFEKYFSCVERNSIIDYSFFPKKSELKEIPVHKAIEIKTDIIMKCLRKKLNEDKYNERK